MDNWNWTENRGKKHWNWTKHEEPIDSPWFKDVTTRCTAENLQTTMPTSRTFSLDVPVIFNRKFVHGWLCYPLAKMWVIKIWKMMYTQRWKSKLRSLLWSVFHNDDNDYWDDDNNNVTVHSKFLTRKHLSTSIPDSFLDYIQKITKIPQVFKGTEIFHSKGNVKKCQKQDKANYFGTDKCHMLICCYCDSLIAIDRKIKR